MNTNAWADPRAVLPPRLLSFIDTLDVDERRTLAERLWGELETHMSHIEEFAAQAAADSESGFAGEWMPPAAVESLAPSSADELLRQLATVDFRWRIDAYETVDDYLTADLD